jgi:hypothetical protein
MLVVEDVQVSDIGQWEILSTVLTTGLNVYGKVAEAKKAKSDAKKAQAQAAAAKAAEISKLPGINVTGQSSGMPSWVVPVAVGGGVLLISVIAIAIIVGMSSSRKEIAP